MTEWIPNEGCRVKVHGGLRGTVVTLDGDFALVELDQGFQGRPNRRFTILLKHLAPLV